MSHFTRIRTRLTDGRLLREALERMGHTVRPPGRGVVGYRGQRTDAEFKICPRTGEHEIGFAPSANGYVLVADWWGINSVAKKAFTRELNQQYALVSAVSTLEARGFRIDEQIQDETGEIRVVLRRHAGM